MKQLGFLVDRSAIRMHPGGVFDSADLAEVELTCAWGEYTFAEGWLSGFALVPPGVNKALRTLLWAGDL